MISGSDSRQYLEEIIIDPSSDSSTDSSDKQALENILFFLANIPNSEKLLSNLASKLPANIDPEEREKEAIRKFQKCLEVFRQNFDKLEFFESSDLEKIGKSLALSTQRAIEKDSNIKPESRLELSAYRSYFTGTDDFKDGKFFDSLDRDSQSILMGCAIIICAVNAINQAKQNSGSDLESHALEPVTYSEILKPLIQYSQAKKDHHEVNKILLMNASFSKQYVGILCTLKNISATLGLSIAENIRKNKIPDVDKRNLNAKDSFIVATAFSVIVETLNGLSSGGNENYQTSPAKLLRNEAICLATSALIYSVYNAFKVDVPRGHDFEDEEKYLFARSYLITKLANTVFGSILLLPKNFIRDGYEMIDKKLDKISAKIFYGLCATCSALSGACHGAFKGKDNKIQAEINLETPTSEQREFFSKYFSRIFGLSLSGQPQSTMQLAVSTTQLQSHEQLKQ